MPGAAFNLVLLSGIVELHDGNPVLGPRVQVRFFEPPLLLIRGKKWGYSSEGTASVRRSPIISKRMTQEQKSHSASLMPFRADETGNVRKHSEHVTAIVPLSFFTQTAALFGF